MNPRLLAVFAALQVATATGNNNTQRIAVNGIDIELNPSMQHIPLDPAQQDIRPPPPQIPETFDIFIGSSVFRDAYRCGRTFFSAFSRASHPDRLHIGLIEQIYEDDGKCIDEYCKLAEAEWPDKGACPYKNQIKVETHSAAEARGCTTARHAQQKLIGDEEFCLQVDAHSHFMNDWDGLLVADWVRADNEMAVLSTYPYEAYDFVEQGDNPSFNSYPHLCVYIPFGNGKVMYPHTGMIHNYQTPQLGAFWGGGLSFSKCHAERNVPVDPHTPWLWDGEEFLRSAILFTHGYDLYSPSERGSVIYHNYTKNSNQRSWISAVDEEVKKLETEKSHNRYRLQVGVAFDGLVNTFELNKYSFGKARSFQEYLKFSNVTLNEGVEDASPCRQLHWMPYTNVSVVEEITGSEWRFQSGNSSAVPQKEVELNIPSDEAVDVRGELRDVKEITRLQHEKARFAIETEFVAPVWFLLGLVVAGIFVAVSKRTSRLNLPNHVSSQKALDAK